MQYIAESEYWVSPDMTLWHPDLFASRGGIVRMARMRNPHQICACAMGNGEIALLHQDSYAQISGWSRLNVGNSVLDLCVLPKSDGTDVLYALVRRNVTGINKLYLEAIADWTYGEENNWNYTRSSVTFIPSAPTNIITGLDHLEGKIVQVVSNQDYLGSWKVASGQITMLDGTGAAINVDNAQVGMEMACRLRTMPVIGNDPGAQKRFTSLYVRCRNSSRPLINGERPADRDPERPLDEAQDLDIIQDYETVVLGQNRTQVISIRETLPVKTEVLGIFGDLGEHSV